MNRSIKIFQDTDLDDIEKVKQYLQYSLKWRRTKKDFKLYINICVIFERYPETIKNILVNIPTLGYYKDYFYVLMFSKNVILNEFIYDIIIRQLSLDVENLKSDKSISTLGKWLPREKSQINRRCNFIDKFNVRFFPNIKSKITARKHYRKLKTNLNEKLGTIESKICTQEFDKINYDKVAPYALKKLRPILLKNDISRHNLDIHETKLLTQMSLSEFTREIVIAKHSAEKIIDIWNKTISINTIKKLESQIPNILDMMKNSICIADLSNDTYSINGEFTTIGLILLINQYATDNQIFISNCQPKLNGNIIDNASEIIKYIGPSQEFDLKTLISDSSNQPSCVIIITTQQLFNQQYLHDNNINLIQFVPCLNHTFKLIYRDTILINDSMINNSMINNSMIKPVVKPIKKTISQIINESSELNPQSIPMEMMIISLIAVLLVILHANL